MPVASLRHAPSMVLATTWLVAVVVGFGVITEHASQPGSAGSPVDGWPADSSLERSDGLELLVFAHALCPCTDATLSELERTLADVASPPRTRIVIWTDPEQPDVFAESRLRNRAAAMAGVSVIDDPAGRLAACFGAETSGSTMLFDADGRRVFAGGITAGRGHEGSNAGLSALDAHLRGEPAPRTDTPVFGCSLIALSDSGARIDA